MCEAGLAHERQDVPKDQATKYINTPSTASPHIHLEKSPYGLASKGWVDEMARDHGVDSLWYRAHVKAERPKLDNEVLIKPEWLHRAVSDSTARAAMQWRRDRKGGKRRISCDVGEGVGNARTVIIVRDDVGIIEILASVHEKVERTAEIMAEMYRKHEVSIACISFDGAGTTGKDLEKALPAKGLVGVVPYFGSGKCGRRFGNMRSAAAAAFARRLNPDSYHDGKKEDRPFHIPNHPDLNAILEELRELRGQLKGGKYHLEKKTDYKDRLGRSPDFADAVSQSFREEAVSA
jgi:hypothetical protein